MTEPTLTVTDADVRARLERAAEYLETLDDEHFTMCDYSLDGHDPGDVLALEDEAEETGQNCGCLAGHIPHFAPSLTRSIINNHDDAHPHEPIHWRDLASDFIKRSRGSDVLHAWLFDGRWSEVDDTRAGAIERIRTALDSGVPPAFARPDGFSPERYARESAPKTENA